MKSLKLVNLALRFFLELFAVYAYGYWGFTRDTTPLMKWLFGLGIPLLFIVIWGLFLSPKASKSFKEPMKSVCAFILLAMGIIAFGISGPVQAAIIISIILIINQIFLLV